MAAPTTDELKQFIVEELALQHVQAKDIDDGALLFGPDGLGLDSIDGLQIATAIEGRWRVKIPFESPQVRDILATVAAMAEYIKSKS